MKKIYIQFDEPQFNNHKISGRTLKKIYQKIGIRVLNRIIPKANPDYEDEIDNVVSWLIEFDAETHIPIRELGINKEGNVIVKMPYKTNLGYWTDNNLLLDDFIKKFNTKVIDSITFDNKWGLISDVNYKFDFFKTEMLRSRNTNFCLGCFDGSVYMDFGYNEDKRISLLRISFDGYGCCELSEKSNSLNLEMSKSLAEEFKKDELNQENLIPLINEIIKINKEFIWFDALEKYHLI